MRELKDRLDEQPDLTLLDVREDWEYAICHLANSKHIPMQQIPGQLSSLDLEAPIVVICHHGMRSLQVAYFLSQSGFKDVTNLTGGIDAWAREIDQGMATY